MTNKCNWPRGLMDKASVFGTEDCRFESYRGHFFLYRRPEEQHTLLRKTHLAAAILA